MAGAVPDVICSLAHHSPTTRQILHYPQTLSAMTFTSADTRSLVFPGTVHVRVYLARYVASYVSAALQVSPKRGVWEIGKFSLNPAKNV